MAVTVVVPRIVGDVPVPSLGYYPIVGSTLEGQALAIARKYSASVYLPSPLNFSDSAGTTAAVNDGSVGKVNDGKSVDSFPATQSTAGFKPLLIGGPRNLLTYSEDFSNAAWSRLNIQAFGAGSVSNAIGAPDGTLTADKIVETTAAGSHSIRQNVTVSPITNTASIYLKAGERTKVILKYISNTSTFELCFCNLDLSLGTGVWGNSNGASGSTGVITAVGNGWYRCTITGLIAAKTDGQWLIGMRDNGGNESYTGNGTSGLYVWGAQLELGSTASTYVPTTTAAASQGSRPKAWLFDGADDRLSLSGPLFQMSDDHFVVACAKNTSSAATSKPIFSQYGTTTRRCGQLSFETTTLTATWTDDAGTAGTSPTGSAVTAGTTVVATARKAGNNKTLRKNGVDVNTSATAAGTTTLTNAVIGGNATTYAAGNIYGVIAGKGAITDAELLVLEKYLGSLGGLNI